MTTYDILPAWIIDSVNRREREEDDRRPRAELPAPPPEPVEPDRRAPARGSVITLEL